MQIILYKEEGVQKTKQIKQIFFKLIYKNFKVLYFILHLELNKFSSKNLANIPLFLGVRYYFIMNYDVIHSFYIIMKVD